MKYTVSLKGKQSVPPALRQGPERGFAHHGSVLPEKRPAGKPVGPDHGNQAGPRGGPEPSAPPAAGNLPPAGAPALPGYDIVVVARVRAVYSRYAELERDFLRLAKKLQLLSPKVLMRRERSHEGCSALDDPVLPEGHLPCPSPLLPVYPHLLGLCFGGGGEIRGVEGGLSRPAPDSPMQSLSPAEEH